MSSLHHTIASLLILLPLLAFGCSGNGVDPGDSDLSPAFDFPEDWTRQPASGSVILLALSPEEDTADTFRESMNVVVEAYADGRDFDQYVAGSMLALSTALSNYSTVESDPTELGGRRAHRIVYSGTLDNTDLYNLVYLVDGGDRAWTITCSATPESFDRWVTTFDQIAETFRLE